MTGALPGSLALGALVAIVSNSPRSLDDALLVKAPERSAGSTRQGETTHGEATMAMMFWRNSAPRDRSLSWALILVLACLGLAVLAAIDTGGARSSDDMSLVQCP
jgi:hypothetical protein